MNSLIEILIWLNEPSNRNKLGDYELNCITESIEKCTKEIFSVIERVDKEKRFLFYIKSLKRNRKK